MRIVLTGSGSGGHFYPLIAIAEAIAEEVQTKKLLTPQLYLFAPEPYDIEALLTHHITYVHVPAGKMRRYFSVKNVTDLLKTGIGVFVALWRLITLYPDVIMSKGSYTSVPVVVAAFLLRIPIIVHESDLQPGRATMLAARFARTIAISYEGSTGYFSDAKMLAKTVRTGIPVRRRLLTDTGADPFAHLHITPDRPLILVLGGSQGAERVNDLIVSALDALLPSYTILHQTGEAHVQVVGESARALVKDASTLEHYHVRGFFDVDTLRAAFQATSLVISRAGSGSIYEIALFGKPSILIPIPEDISHDQRLNAYAFARTGASSVMEEKNLTPHLLAAEITRIMSDQPARLKMEEATHTFAPGNAAQKLAAILIAICLEHGY